MYIHRIRDWWRGDKKDRPFKVVRDTIKCWCGHDTGLSKNGFLMVIPEGGLICPKCKSVIIQDNRPTMWASDGKNDISIQMSSQRGNEYKSCCLS